MKTILLILFPVLLFSQYETANFKYYSVGYDSIGTHWVTYRLTSEMMQSDTTRKRVSFKRFNDVVTGDYTNTGFDRGHLLAADHMGFDLEGYKETFSMANVAPMTPSLNRQVWKYLENYEERLAVKHKCINTRIDVIYGNKKVRDIYIPEKFIKRITQCGGKPIAEFELENL